MDDRELIAAILTAGMLPILPIPENRTESGEVTDAEGDRILRAVGHAIGLYRSVLEGVGVDPFTGHDAAVSTSSPAETKTGGNSA